MILAMNKACNKGPDRQSPDLNPIQSFHVTSELLGHAHLTVLQFFTLQLYFQPLPLPLPDIRKILAQLYSYDTTVM